MNDHASTTDDAGGSAADLRDAFERYIGADREQNRALWWALDRVNSAHGAEQDLVADEAVEALARHFPHLETTSRSSGMNTSRRWRSARPDRRRRHLRGPGQCPGPPSRAPGRTDAVTVASRIPFLSIRATASRARLRPAVASPLLPSLPR